MRKTPEYSAWSAMIMRCTNPNEANYRSYGAKGVTVCDRWRASFADFFADMGPRPSLTHSLDRINPFGNYEPSNCRWATPEVQAANKRVPPEFPGIGKIVKRLGLHPTTVLKYLRLGLTEAEIPGVVGRTAHCRRCGSDNHNAAGCPEHPKRKNMDSQVRPARSTPPHARLVEHNGKSLSIMGWARVLGVAPKTIRRRLASGAPIDGAAR